MRTQDRGATASGDASTCTPMHRRASASGHPARLSSGSSSTFCRASAFGRASNGAVGKKAQISTFSGQRRCAGSLRGSPTRNERASIHVLRQSSDGHRAVDARCSRSEVTPFEALRGGRAETFVYSMGLLGRTRSRWRRACSSITAFPLPLLPRVEGARIRFPHEIQRAGGETNLAMPSSPWGASEKCSTTGKRSAATRSRAWSVVQKRYRRCASVPAVRGMEILSDQGPTAVSRSDVPSVRLSPAICRQ